MSIYIFWTLPPPPSHLPRLQFSPSSIPSPYFILFLHFFFQLVNSDYMNDKYRVFSNILLLSQYILFYRLPQSERLLRKFHIYLNLFENISSGIYLYNKSDYQKPKHYSCKKNTMLVFSLTIYSTLLAISHHQSKIFSDDNF